MEKDQMGCAEVSGGGKSSVSDGKSSRTAWMPEEDRKLRDFVMVNGRKGWAKIASALEGRTGKQCRNRWYHVLDPDLSNDEWTEEEEQILVDMHRKIGKRWATLSRHIKGRSENAIKNHWNSVNRCKQDHRTVLKKPRSNVLRNYQLELERTGGSSGLTPSASEGDLPPPSPPKMTPEVAALFPAAAEFFSAGHSDPLPAKWKAGDVTRAFESSLEQAGGKRGEAPEGTQTSVQPPLKRGKAGEAMLGQNEFFSGEHFWQRKSIESTSGLVVGINPSFKKRGLIQFPQQLVHSWKQTAAAQRTPPGEVGSSQGELAQAAHGQGKGQIWGGGKGQTMGAPSGHFGGVQNGQNAGGETAEARGEAHVGSAPKEIQREGEGGSGLQKEGGWREIKEPAVSGGAEKPGLPCAHDQEKGPPPNPGPAKVSRFRVPDTLFLPRERKGKRGKAVPRVGDDVIVGKDVRGCVADNPLEGGGAGRAPELPVRKGGIAVESSGRAGVSFGMIGLEQKKGLGLANWGTSGPGNQGSQLGSLKDKGTPEGEKRPADAPAPVALLGGGVESSPTGVLEGARGSPKEDKIRSFLQRWETRSADKWQENEAAAAGGGGQKTRRRRPTRTSRPRPRSLAPGG